MINKYKNISYYIILISLLCSINVDAQSRRGRGGFGDGLSLSLLAGPNISAMDLGEKETLGLTYGISVFKSLSPKWAVDFSVLAGNFSGARDDNNKNSIYYGQRQLYFESNYFEFGLSAVADISSILNDYYRYRTVSFLLTAGVGYMSFDSQSKWDNANGHAPDSNDNNHIAPDHAGPGTSPIIKGGAIIRYRIDDKWGLRFQGKINYAISDRLDGYEHFGFDYNGPGKPVMTDNKDVYSTFLVGVEYKFGIGSYRSSSRYNRKIYSKKYTKRYTKRTPSSRRRR